MKTLITILMGVLYLSVYGQIKPLVIAQKQVQNTTILSVSNTTPQEYAFTLSLTLTGMTADRPTPIFGQVPGGEEKEVVVLTAMSGQQPHFEYILNPVLLSTDEADITIHKKNTKRKKLANSSNQYTKKASKNIQSELNPKLLSVFTEIDCSRCEISIGFLKKNKVKFKEYDTSNSLKYKDLMWNALYVYGQKEGRVSLPVFVYESKVYYSIEDLEGFLFGLVGK